MTPRKGCRYVFEPCWMDRDLFPRGVVVTVVPCPGMPRAVVPRKFRYVEHNGVVHMVESASLVPYRKYRRINTTGMVPRTAAQAECKLARVTAYLRDVVDNMRQLQEEHRDWGCSWSAAQLEPHIYDVTDAAVIVMARRADMKLARLREAKARRCTCENNGDLCPALPGYQGRRG